MAIGANGIQSEGASTFGISAEGKGADYVCADGVSAEVLIEMDWRPL
jgi:hypothetical protein